MHVLLNLEEHGDAALFIANGQEDNDVIDASNSTMHMILIGDGGDDVIYGGLNENVLIGDYGEVMWVDPETGVIVARQGGGEWLIYFQFSWWYFQNNLLTGTYIQFYVLFRQAVMVISLTTLFATFILSSHFIHPFLLGEWLLIVMIVGVTLYMGMAVVI